MCVCSCELWNTIVLGRSCRKIQEDESRTAASLPDTFYSGDTATKGDKCYNPQHGDFHESLPIAALTPARPKSHNDSSATVPNSQMDQGSASVMNPKNTGSDMSIFETQKPRVADLFCNQVRTSPILETSVRCTSDKDNAATVLKSSRDNGSTADIIPQNIFGDTSISDMISQHVAGPLCHQAGTSSTVVMSSSFQQLGGSSHGNSVVSKRSLEQIAQSRELALKRLRMSQELRPYQREAMSILSKAKHHAFIIMPTGSGKTTLVSSFKPVDTCSLVFAPFKVLVKQLGTVLAQKGKVVSYPFVSNDGDMYTILATADFIIMPYEAAPTSADMVCSLNSIGRLGPIWIDEVHNLTTACRFRLSLDSFWNLQAELHTRGLSPKMIGLSATLRPEDVPDVMRRLSIANVDVYRRSCHRAELGFKFEKPFKYEKDMITRATELAIERSKQGKVMVFTSTVNLCEVMMDQIQSRFQG
jgi:hypothetical protein